MQHPAFSKRCGSLIVHVCVHIQYARVYTLCVCVCVCVCEYTRVFVSGGFVAWSGKRVQWEGGGLSTALCICLSLSTRVHTSAHEFMYT